LEWYLNATADFQREAEPEDDHHCRDDDGREDRETDNNQLCLLPPKPLWHPPAPRNRRTSSPSTQKRDFLYGDRKNLRKA
jgi:hypothetical protein